METKRIKVSELEPNTGQIDGLPINPRQWTKTDVDKIAASLKETPELFEARPLIVTPHAGKYVILGGNLRFEGVKKNKDKDAPCIIVPEDTPIGKLKEIVVKDNGSFGAWDYDALANEWDDLPLADWGVPSWDTEDDAEDLAKTPIDIEGLFDPTKERPGGPAPAATLAVEIPIGLEEEVDDIVQAVKAAVAGFDGVTVTKK